MVSKFEQVIRGKVWKFGDSIDTNQLAGVAEAQTMEDFKAGCLASLRPEFPFKVKPGDLIVAGENFGSGSSRQSAVEVLMYIGIQAVIVESVARIYFRTSMALAFPLFVAPGITGIVDDGDELGINYLLGVANNFKTGAEVKLNKYAPSVERIFEVGGLVNLITQRLKEQGISTPL